MFINRIKLKDPIHLKSVYTYLEQEKSLCIIYLLYIKKRIFLRNYKKRTFSINRGSEPKNIEYFLYIVVILSIRISLSKISCYQKKREVFISTNDKSTIILDKTEDSTYKNKTYKFDAKDSSLYINEKKEYQADK